MFKMPTIIYNEGNSGDEDPFTENLRVVKNSSEIKDNNSISIVTGINDNTNLIKNFKPNSFGSNQVISSNSSFKFDTQKKMYVHQHEVDEVTKHSESKSLLESDKYKEISIGKLSKQPKQDGAVFFTEINENANKSILNKMNQNLKPPKPETIKDILKNFEPHDYIFLGFEDGVIQQYSISRRKKLAHLDQTKTKGMEKNQVLVRNKRVLVLGITPNNKYLFAGYQGGF